LRHAPRAPLAVHEHVEELDDVLVGEEPLKMLRLVKPVLQKK
jgi:hypothetical protein